ncbi:MAG: hypothetical protein JJ911_04225 [Rhizobiaceae bacterium]|nr:hypothetical protein [Rhizobiaceae bacterium]
MIDLRMQQKIQHRHDRENHFDILCLPRTDRLKHYGLHFAKYAGRLARGARERKSRDETFVDAVLVCLSAANTLNQALEFREEDRSMNDLNFTDAAGRFADACEKIDHLENFLDIAYEANADIARWLLISCKNHQIDLGSRLTDRRDELSKRAVYSGE